MSHWWRHEIIEPGKLPLVLALAAFVVTFVITRGITRMIRSGRGPFRDRVTSGGLHIHHAVPGLIILVVGAFTGVGATNSPWSETAGVLVGIGAALVLDEFALILHLEDTYWSNEGRVSIDVITVAASVVSLALLGFTPVSNDQLSADGLPAFFATVAALLTHLSLIVVCALKGKAWWSIFAIVLPPLSLIGAIRLARPASWWSKRFYGDKKRERATRRANAFAKRWEPLAQWWQRFAGGLPEQKS